MSMFTRVAALLSGARGANGPPGSAGADGVPENSPAVRGQQGLVSADKQNNAVHFSGLYGGSNSSGNPSTTGTGTITNARTVKYTTGAPGTSGGFTCGAGAIGVHKALLAPQIMAFLAPANKPTGFVFFLGLTTKSVSGMTGENPTGDYIGFQFSNFIRGDTVIQYVCKDNVTQQLAASTVPYTIGAPLYFKITGNANGTTWLLEILNASFTLLDSHTFTVADHVPRTTANLDPCLFIENESLPPQIDFAYLKGINPNG